MSKTEQLSEQLFDAINKDNEDKIEELIKKGADVNALNNNGETPLCYAIRKGQISIIKALLESGADVNAQDNLGNIPLYHAARTGQISIIKILLKNGADVNAGNIWMQYGAALSEKVREASTFITQHIEKREIAGLPVSLENSQQKDFFSSFMLIGAV